MTKLLKMLLNMCKLAVTEITLHQGLNILNMIHFSESRSIFCSENDSPQMVLQVFCGNLRGSFIRRVIGGCEASPQWQHSALLSVAKKLSLSCHFSALPLCGEIKRLKITVVQHNLRLMTNETT